jgi:glycosyltransferase involved in cell wall biosynthesis
VKVALISTSDIEGGAARACFRLFEGLRRSNTDARLFVRRKSDPSKLGGLGSEVSGAHSGLGKTLGKALRQVDRLPPRLYPRRKGLFTPALIPNPAVSLLRSRPYDLLHLHWVADGYLSIEELAAVRKPVVWTLHDMWPFTGGCHYDEECGRYVQSCGQCPILGSHSSNDLSKLVLARKRLAWRRLNLTIVAPSKWLAECARQSSLFKKMQVRVEVIPYGVDTQIFRPRNREELRSKLALPTDRKLVLFGATHGTQDQRKGFHHLTAALSKLRDRGLHRTVDVAIFGSRTGPEEIEGFKVRNLGILEGECTASEAYSACDAFVAPSTQENLANTVLESLASGTPAVAFDIGGMPDMIEPGKTGYLARPFDAEDLARAIEKTLLDPTLREGSRKKALKEYTLERSAESYRRLYAEILSGSEPLP